MNHFGISEKSLSLILEAFAQYSEIDEVIIFGSRAKGNYKKGSDIDLAIRGNNCNEGLAMDISVNINEKLPIPYMVDVLDYNSLHHKELKAHIDRVGITIYDKQS